MKKETLLKIAFVFAVATLYSSAYASTDFSTSTTLSVGAQQVKPSNKVTIRCASESSSFAAQSAHSSGDRIFGTTYTDTKIYWKEVSPAVVESVTTGAVFTGSGWSSL